jgi:hypothetical protein
MCGIHDVGTSGLSQIVELADHRPIVEVEIKCRFFLEGMQMQGALAWNKFGLGILDPDVFNDLALLAQAALRGEMHAPCHVVFKPVVRVLAHLLGLSGGTGGPFAAAAK